MMKAGHGINTTGQAGYYSDGCLYASYEWFGAD